MECLRHASVTPTSLDGLYTGRSWKYSTCKACDGSYMGVRQSSMPRKTREQLPHCIFCRIARGQEPNKILYEDDRYIAFNDIRPAAKQHILVITKAHIDSILALRQCTEDVRIAHTNCYQAEVLKGESSQVPVEDMVRVGNKLLSSIEPNREHKFGFHVPPWNSVDHLHLHCFALPHRGCLALKYKETDTAWAGYMTAAQAVERLQPGMQEETLAQQ